MIREADVLAAWLAGDDERVVLLIGEMTPDERVTLPAHVRELERLTIRDMHSRHLRKQREQ